jgi:L-alanine-DL-glutamate epimerase-like enolase superfamily enzyme
VHELLGVMLFDSPWLCLNMPIFKLICWLDKSIRCSCPTKIHVMDYMNFITDTKITSLSFPLDQPFSNHERRITHIKGLNIQLITRNGISGHGLIYGLSDMPHQEIIALIESEILSKLAVEIENAEQLMSSWKKIWPLLKSQQHTQSELTALAIVDIAIWDIFLKSKNTSLHQFLGASQSKVPAYGTTGWLSLSLDELVDECRSYQENGINAFKIRLGHQEDALRVKTVREVMGDQFVLMLDANQRYSVNEAIQVSSDLAPYNLLWLEEPTENKLEVISQIKNGSVIPIALGENFIDEKDFIEICQNKLTDILQPDLPRCGGITGFIRVADIALRNGIPICNHLLYELSVSIIAAYENGYMLECDNLLPAGVFKNSFKAKEGNISPPHTPGNGVELTEEALLQYGLAVHAHLRKDKIKSSRRLG